MSRPITLPGNKPSPDLARPTPYVLVEDVPASWDRYAVLTRSMTPLTAGLLLHVAGPTDEGFRIVEVWDSEASWQRHADVFTAALGSVDPDVPTRTTVRDLRALHLVLGAAWPIQAQPTARQSKEPPES